MFLSSLINRQVAILNGQGQNTHGRAIVASGGLVVAVTGEPAPVLLLVLVENRRELLLISLECLVADLEHGLRAVVSFVEEVSAAPLRGMLEQIFRSGHRFGREMSITDFQPEDADARAGVIRAASRLVREAAVLDGASLQIAGSAINARRVDRAAGSSWQRAGPSVASR